MQVLLTVVAVLQMLAALVMIGLVLIQHGKGADMGASFGSGASGSLFGASGSANFLSRFTGVCAAVFFACTLALAYFGNLRVPSGGSGSILEQAAPAASSPTSQIPGEIPAASGASGSTGAVTSPAPVASQPAASGAAQIPTR